VLADLVNLHDAGVVQPSHRLRLDLEARQLLGAGVAAGQDHLQCDDPIQLRLPGLVDDTHAATAQLAQDLVAGW
jgi:hypothetical protein